jgi:putative colanic acid biosynthesis acetyltransferase WcaF
MNDEILQAPDPRTSASFSRSNRIRRAAWGVVYGLFFRPSPRPAHGWRAFLLRLFGARLGKHVHVYPKAVVWAPWNLEIEDRVGVGDGAELYNIAPIRLEREATVSQGAFLCTGTHDFEDPSFQLVSRPITVRAQAWIAAQAFVGPGVEVGEGAVVGARAVVSRRVEPWTVVAGNPARVLRARQRPDRTETR